MVKAIALNTCFISLQIRNISVYSLTLNGISALSPM
jgi:hypothetical protein